MSLLRKILQNPAGILITSSFLTLFGAYPAFILVNKGFFVKDSLWFLITADFSALLIMFGVVYFIIKFVFNKPLEDFGFRPPNNWLEAAPDFECAFLLEEKKDSGGFTEK